MAQEITDAVRFQVQTVLHNAGLSYNGALEFANGQIVSDPSDRATIVEFVVALVSDRALHTKKFPNIVLKRGIIGNLAPAPAN